MTPIIRKDRIWPTIIVTVLTSYVIFGFIAARIATHDPNFAVEPDYYRKAVAWDSTLAQAKRSAALGWQLTPVLGPIGNGTAAPLTLQVRDSTGAPVSAVQVSVEARQVAHADAVVRGTLSPVGDGAYTALLPLAHAGLWEFRVVATRGADRFTSSVRMDASVAANAQLVTERPGDAIPARAIAGERRESATSPARP
ncbi:MAG: FixH family protein [bacterium]